MTHILTPMPAVLQNRTRVNHDSQFHTMSILKRMSRDSEDTPYTKSTLSWRGEEAKSLVRAQVISHLEWIKKGRKKGGKKREEKKIGRGVTGKICALHISCMWPGK